MNYLHILERLFGLAVCLPVFHQLIHVSDGLRWISPMHTYAQWAMERMCGILTRTVKSRVSANRNMGLILLMTEQKHVFAYTLDLTDWSPHIEQDYNYDSDNEEIWIKMEICFYQGYLRTGFQKSSRLS